MEPVLCSAVTNTHLALGMPSGMLSVYEIGDLLEQVEAQQASTVDKFSRTWQHPEGRKAGAEADSGAPLAAQSGTLRLPAPSPCA